MKSSKSFSKKLFTLMFPIALQQFMLALVSASDALMLGALNQDALSAVSLAGQITFIETLFLGGMTIGLSILAAQYWGKNDKGAVERIFAYTMKITVIVSFVFFVAGLSIPNLLMRIFTNDQQLIDNGTVYLKVVSPSFFITGISQIYLCILKNSSKATKSSLISSVCVIINIILNAVLIFGLFRFPKMEIAGAALATVIAKLIELAWCIIETAKKDSIKLRLHNIIHDDKTLRRDFWKYAAPVMGNQFVWGIGFSMYSVIMGHLGSDDVAANSIANIIKDLVACFSTGLGNGSSIIIGNELGAGELEDAKQSGANLCKLSVIIGFISGAVLLLASPLILNFSQLSTQSQFYLKWMIVMCSYNMIGKSVNGTTIAGIFCAGGDSKFGFMCDAVTMWCVIIPLGLISAFVLKLPVIAVYFIINLDEIVKLPAVYIHYKKYKWVKDLTIKV